MPKSVSRTRPSRSTSTLEGFTSRWTIPSAWTAASPSRIWVAYSNRLPDRQGRVLRDQRRQRLAVDQFHDEEQITLVLARVVDGHQMGVIQPCR